MRKFVISSPAAGIFGGFQLRDGQRKLCWVRAIDDLTVRDIVHYATRTEAEIALKTVRVHARDAYIVETSA